MQTVVKQERLVKNKIDFIIVGGAAATAHGSARVQFWKNVNNINSSFRDSLPDKPQIKSNKTFPPA